MLYSRHLMEKTHITAPTARCWDSFPPTFLMLSPGAVPKGTGGQSSALHPALGKYPGEAIGCCSLGTTT